MGKGANRARARVRARARRGMRAKRLGGQEGDQVEMLNGWPVGRRGHIFRSRVSADGSQVQVFRFGYGFRI